MDLDPETQYTCSLGCKANRRERVEGRNELKFGGEKSKTIADSKLSDWRGAPVMKSKNEP